MIYRIDYKSDKSYTGQEAIDRALKRADECSYNLLSNNCESFCTWVKINENNSAQAETGMGLAAGAAAVGTVVLLTFAVFKAFSGANNKSKWCETCDIETPWILNLMLQILRAS